MIGVKKRKISECFEINAGWREGSIIEPAQKHTLYRRNDKECWQSARFHHLSWHWLPILHALYAEMQLERRWIMGKSEGQRLRRTIYFAHSLVSRRSKGWEVMGKWERERQLHASRTDKEQSGGKGTYLVLIIIADLLIPSYRQQFSHASTHRPKRLERLLLSTIEQSRHFMFIKIGDLSRFGPEIQSCRTLD